MSAVGETGRDDLPERMREPIARALEGAGGVESVAPLGTTEWVADGTRKLLVRGPGGRPRAVALVSSPLSPGLIRRGVERAEGARELLGAPLGDAVLEPLGTGELDDGLSWVILPWANPLPGARIAGYLPRRRVGRALLRWLRRATARTLGPPDEDGVATRARAALEQLHGNETAGEPLRGAASEALRSLDAGQWAPRAVLAHNDLWLGNVLLRQARGPLEARLVLIDWGGADLRGAPVFDLVRAANSFPVPRASLRSELEAHCAILGCEPRFAEAHLLTAIARMGLQLEYFPVDSYLQMARRSLALLRGALA